MLEYQQLSMFPTAQDEIVAKINELFPGQNIVDIDNLCTLFPRLALVREIAEQNHFMHWELEFADLFAERGGFDLVIGNPPWILMLWNEQDVLADSNPVFAIRNMSAAETSRERSIALANASVYRMYFQEYEQMASTQSYMCAAQNYDCLLGMKTNLFKCFLPQAWAFTNKSGISAYVHPDGVYDDPKGGRLRKILYPRLRRHFQFTNELKLFAEVHHNTIFSLNVYCNTFSPAFDSISNLFSPSAIEECYDKHITGNVPGIKDESGKWSVHGHPRRIVRVGKKELSLFAKLFDDSEEWECARLPALHTQLLLDALERFAVQPSTIATIPESDIAYAGLYD